MRKVIIFSAPSGSGKTTLVKHALEKFPELCFSVSCTTRNPRGEEQNGKDYYFISPEEFRTRIYAEDFVEFEEVYEDKYYGTLKSEVEKIWGECKTVIFDVDVQGGIALKKYFGESALSIFIMPPSIEELERRLILRGTDDRDTVEIRVAKAAEEMKFQNQFDRVILNVDLDVAKAAVEESVGNFLHEPAAL